MKKEQTLNVSRGLKKIIDGAISALPEDEKNNKYSICEKVAADLWNRYVVEDASGDDSELKLGTFNYQTKRMGVETTGQILQKIELYMLTSARKSLN